MIWPAPLPSSRGTAYRPEFCRNARQSRRRARSPGDWDGAIAEAREAVRLNPNIAVAHANLGAALGWKGERDAEIEEEREALRWTRILPPGTTTSALHFPQGDRDGALAEVREAVRSNPNYFEARTSLGALLTRKGDLG